MITFGKPLDLCPHMPYISNVGIIIHFIRNNLPLYIYIHTHVHTIPIIVEYVSLISDIDSVVL